ncbi:citrate synthase [Desulforhabdus amnigena]|uniref:Citrate synthase n=1 Tax=Desulforhabdus amnigena TaxID=40218 RepID=A0A9W6FWM7_9BACT|nr:citrate synthase [Desulforhabdus amnigena]GLI36204.1 citrate synthase [Desulforhabdus amnigena]
MAEEVRVKNIGLRGVTVADTKISYIDGEHGILIYRGFRIEELAERSTFPETAYLLLNGALPNKQQLVQFEQELVEGRQLPAYLYDVFKKLPRSSDPMDVLQAAVPLLAVNDPDLNDESREANVRKAMRLIARFPVVVAAWHRIRHGLEPLPSDDSLSHAANFLWQLTGQKPDAETARDFDICLILHADHTFNASTFACREVVSTQAHMYAGVAAGVGALSGSLHGGANARVMEMLQQVESEVKAVDEVGAWVRDRIDRGEKIMGMGHAVYKTFDPRSKILKEMSLRLGKKTGRENWYRLLTRIEEEGIREFEKRGKMGIKINVDFYSGSVYAMMGIPVDIMTPVFAISRISGWCSHIIEEKFGEAQGKPALYRPKAEYVGDYCGPIGCEFKPLTER